MTSGAFGLTDEPEPGAPIAVSRLEFDVLWESLALGEMPLVLKVESPGRTHTERRQLVEDAWRAMENRGFARSAAEYERLAELVRLLARPEREIDGRLWFGSKVGSVRVLVAAQRRRRGHGHPHRGRHGPAEAAPSGLAREALSVLPPLAAGPGESVTVPSRQLEAAAAECRHPNGIRDRAARERHARPGRRPARRDDDAPAKTRPVRRGHPRPLGPPHPRPRVVSMFDTRAGRYLQTRSIAEPDTEPWTTVSPADQRLLISQLEELSTN